MIHRKRRGCIYKLKSKNTLISKARQKPSVRNVYRRGKFENNIIIHGQCDLSTIDASLYCCWLLLFCLVAAVVLILQLISREPRLKVRHTNQSALRLIARHGGVVCVVYNRKPDFKHFVYATYMLTQCVQRTERTNKISTKTTRRRDRMNKPRARNE